MGLTLPYTDSLGDIIELKQRSSVYGTACRMDGWTDNDPVVTSLLEFSYPISVRLRFEMITGAIKLEQRNASAYIWK